MKLRSLDSRKTQFLPQWGIWPEFFYSDVHVFKIIFIRFVRFVIFVNKAACLQIKEKKIFYSIGLLLYVINTCFNAKGIFFL